MFRISRRHLGSLLLVLLLVSALLMGCTSQEADSGGDSAPDSSQGDMTGGASAAGIPKYVFLFIGDGMSFPQISALGYYNGTVEHDFSGTLKEPTPDNAPQAEMPSFIDFPVVGSCTTYDSSKFVTDSASAATAIASGVKTLDGIIGQDAYNNDAPSIAELIKEQTDYKIGVITSVSLDHATPAAFYAHQASRNDYYDIALQLIDSGYDFFGGGGFYYMNGPEDDVDKSLFDLAEEAGYTVANTVDDIRALGPDSGPAIAVNPELDGMNAIPYAIDLDKTTSLSLDEYVSKGLEVMGDEQGFFMMVESGKIDWAGHHNDALTGIHEVKALEDSVNVALEFANEHPDETLILITGDHETGGWSNGYQGTEYDTYFSLLDGQTVSYNTYTEVAKTYHEAGTTFEQAMADVKQYFGLVMPDDPDAANTDPGLVLTERDMAMFREAYDLTMLPADERDTKDEGYRELYGTYNAEPIVITATHVLNNKAGIGWSTTSHSALPAAVFAKGVGQDEFNGFYDNTDIFHKLKNLMQLS